MYAIFVAITCNLTARVIVWVCHIVSLSESKVVHLHIGRNLIVQSTILMFKIMIHI